MADRPKTDRRVNQLKNGQRVPGVTTVLGVLAKPVLVALG
jgi:hypothetical protein